MSLLSDSQPARKPRRTARRAYALVERLSRTVGAVLANRRPHHPVGWLLLVLGLSLAVAGVAAAYAAYGLVARPGALPAASEVARCYFATVVVGLPLLSFVLL